ncbi:hypothetical protein GCM10009775_09950 [Microbacterium aoyamense]|uniref:Glycosyltransferase n=1 Tax=Microbacterium aoyamense TaxID=344166 RepID=A0ABP5APN5_9MICO|nr:glycosyltransferase [Microbacterium aoyamense]
MSRDLVVLSLESWDDVWRRNQYLIDGLLRRDPELRVLFVEPANDLLHSYLSRRDVSRGRGLRIADDYDGRLLLFQPTKLLPRAAGPAADALLRAEVRRVIRRQRMKAPVLWVNDPSWAGLVRSTGWPSLYDMTDDWLAADRSEREIERITDNEDILMNDCVAVVVCSEGLQATRASQREVVLIPNGVDVDRYRRPQERPADLPPRSALYLGTQHEDRLDIDLVLRTADAALQVGGRVVLVGPSAVSVENWTRLARHDGVVSLGRRAWTDVPAYLQHATALLVPHHVNDFTDSLDPIKLYEYLAVGRPVISTPVAGFRSLAGPTITIADADGFPEAVAAALRDDPPTVLGADVPDWSDRVEDYAGVLDPLLGE